MSGRPPALPGYEVTGELGRGGMGVVWAGVERRSGRPVAIKVMSDLVASDPETRLRFQREVSALRGLLHPNVVQLLDAGADGACPCLVLERLPGGSLADLLRRGPVAPERAAALVAGAARGVHAAHELGLIHRDIKPGNVLLAEDGTPKVADFGLVRRVDSRSLTATGVAVGTPEAMAPEQIVGGPLDARVDVWALGVLLYQLLVGRGPWGPTTAGPALFEAILHAPIAPPSYALRGAPDPGVDAALDALVLGCLERDVEGRPPSALALALALEGWLAARGGPARGRAWREARRRRRLVQGLVGVAVAGCAAVVVAVTRAGPPTPVTTTPVTTTPVAPAPVAPVSEAPPPPPDAPVAPATLDLAAPAMLRLREQVQRHAAAGDPDGALGALLVAGEDVQQDHVLSMHLGYAYLNRAERRARGGESAAEDAAEAIRVVSAVAESSATALVIEARARVLLGDPEAAAAVFHEALRRDPQVARDLEVVRAATRAGAATFDLGPLAEVSLFVRPVLAPQALRLFGDARDYYARLTASASEDPAGEVEELAEALVALGRTSAVLLDAEGAEAALDRATRLAPRSARGWLARAEWRLSLGELEEAADDLGVAQALATAPGRPRDERQVAGLALLATMAGAAATATRGDVPQARAMIERANAGAAAPRAPLGIAAAARRLELRLQQLPDGARPEARALFAPPEPDGRPPPPEPRRRPLPPPRDPRGRPVPPPLAALPAGHPLERVKALLEARRPDEAFAALEEALAASGTDPLVDEAGLNVAIYVALASCSDLIRVSFLEPPGQEPPELSRRQAVLERIAARAAGSSLLGLTLFGVLARARHSVGDQAGTRAALLEAGRGTDGFAAAVQLFEAELGAGTYDGAERALELMRGAPQLPPAAVDALAAVLAALRAEGTPEARRAALHQSHVRLQEVMRAWPGLLDPRLGPWLLARRAALDAR